MKFLKEAKKRKQPKWVSPMLATLIDAPFSGKDWIFEKKFDGVRCIVIRNDRKVTLYSRNQRKMNAAYPELIEPFLQLHPQKFILDGEIVARQGKLESFSKLQSRMNIRNAKKALEKKVSIAFYAFDLLYLNGYDLQKVPLIERKKTLQSAFSFKKPLFYTTHKAQSGIEYFLQVCREGYEGVIAKKAAGAYLCKRSRSWLKCKGTHSQEFVIAGYTKPRGSRIGFGALLIGYFEKGELQYAGKVGTGYDKATLEMLGKKLEKIEITTCPFSKTPRLSAYWVRPILVCEIGFTEWTKEKKLRHPRFLGLRKDKSARSVKREG